MGVKCLKFCHSSAHEFDVNDITVNVRVAKAEVTDDFGAVVRILPGNHDYHVNDGNAGRSLISLSDLFHLPPEKSGELLYDLRHL